MSRVSPLTEMTCCKVVLNHGNVLLVQQGNVLHKMVLLVRSLFTSRVFPFNRLVLLQDSVKPWYSVVGTTGQCSS